MPQMKINVFVRNCVYSMEFLSTIGNFYLERFNVKVGRVDTFKLRLANESLRETCEYSEVIMVNFAMSKM
jgi:hypothetical protein